MKKSSVVAVALTLAVSLAGIANAGIKGGSGGCNNCLKSGAGASSDPYRKFQADTLDLRQDMMNKRFELQRENLQGKPNNLKVAELQADIKLLQTKILEIRTQSGLPADRCDGECGQKSGDCNKQGMNPCGNGPCGQK